MIVLKKKIIDIQSHALFRMLERGNKFGLDYYEAKKRAFETIKLGKLAKRKHISKKHKTYYRYFQDNLSFYIKYLIRAVIIEEGRQ